MSDDDPIQRRAAEIRAEQARAQTDAGVRDGDLRAERLRLVQRFLDALTDKTMHAVECVEADQRPHGATARFNFITDGAPSNLIMFEFGIDRVEGEPGNRTFSYFLEPSTAAFAIPNPDTGIARPLMNASEIVVVNYGVTIAIELMARVIAAGGMLGTAAQVRAEADNRVRLATERKRSERRERSKKLWSGCLKAFLWFFGICFAIGFLGNVIRACSGQ